MMNEHAAHTARHAEATHDGMTTVFQIDAQTGERQRVWSGEQADIAHLETAFGGLANLHPGRVYEIEQDGSVVKRLSDDCRQCNEPECPGDYSHFEG